MDDCIFCKIIKGELPSAVIYEDDALIAFLDLFPVSRGHALLVPKKHYRNIFDADMETAALIYPTLSRLANAIRAATGCEGLNIIQNNEAVAMQMVFHSHVHLIPRYADDNIKLAVAGKQQASGDQLAEMAGKIKGAIIL
ncbi:MAG: HIT family protein [Deferribacteraceae bacterium]|jgi:histidine triad (HIT) family protein|nr:HIT family protein [Deferribacteraceae bacterium]